MYALSLGINFARIYLSSAVRKSSLNSNAVSPLQLEILLSDLTLAPPYYPITELLEALPADINITKLTQAEQQCHVFLIVVSGAITFGAGMCTWGVCLDLSMVYSADAIYPTLCPMQ